MRACRGHEDSACGAVGMRTVHAGMPWSVWGCGHEDSACGHAVVMRTVRVGLWA